MGHLGMQRLFLLLLMTLFGIVGCGSRSEPVPPAPPIPPLAHTETSQIMDGELTFPSPLSIAPVEFKVGRVRAGLQFEEKLPNQNTSTNPVQIWLRPAWVYEEEFTAEDTAFTYYTFTMDNYAGPAIVQLIEEALSMPDSVGDYRVATTWVGFAHWQTNTWWWYEYKFELDVKSFSPFQNEYHELLMVVLAEGGNYGPVINEVILGDRHPGWKNWEITQLAPPTEYSGAEMAPENGWSFLSSRTDSQGNTHAFFEDNSHNNAVRAMFYGLFDGNTWSTEHVGIGTHFSAASEMVIGPNGQPHIVFRNGSENNFFHITRLDGTWITSAPMLANPYRNSLELAVDASNTPHTVHLNNSREQVVYSYIESGEWQQHTFLPEGWRQWQVRFALDVAGNPVIAYSTVDADDIHLIYIMRFDGDQWAKSIYESTGTSVTFEEVLVENNGRVHLLGRRTSRWLGELVHFSLTNSTWKETIVDAVRVYDVNGLVDEKGVVHAAYYDETTRDLSYARFYRGEWAVETVYSLGGRNPQISLDASNSPTISFESIQLYPDKPIALIANRRR